jgi:DNA-directed RNA polymerase, mitochondrial
MPTLRESIRIDDKYLNRSVERIAAADEQRASITGFATGRQGRALWQEYVDQLTAVIDADLRKSRKDKTVAAALKSKKSEDLAADLLFAGLTIGVGDEPIACGNALSWIGRVLGYQRETALRVGDWGRRMLLQLPIFVLEDGLPTLQLTDDIDNLLTNAIANAASARPLLLPTAEPPVPWTQVNRGATPPDHWAQPPLVNHHPQVDRAFRRAISDGLMRTVLDALNFMQSVPLAINRPILSLLSQMMPVWHHARGIRREEIERWRAMRLDQTIAIVLADGPFYVPLRLDFRGRVCPIPSFSFTREDEIRALFLFANGAPIGSEGLRWLKAHVAAKADGNTWGSNPKPSRLNLEGRIAWTDANIARLTIIGKAVLLGTPLALDDLPSDAPYQFAAACVEFVQALEAGPDYITRLPLTFDGSCSGLQHLCAMTRAEEGRYVNLVANEEPGDFYSLIAKKVYETCSDLMRGSDDRAIVKKPCMTYFYGSRPGRFAPNKKTGRFEPHGMTEQVAEVLKERKQSPKDAKRLAHAIYAAIEGMVPSAKEVRDFLERLCKECSNKGRPLRWTTPLGLPVINCYYKPLIKRFSFSLNGRRYRVKWIVGDTDKINSRGAANAVTANFVHSCDAAHLHMIALAAQSEDIKMVSVHDSFGCLAPNAKRFNEIIREQFYNLHAENDLLGTVSLPRGVTPSTRPQMGTLDLLQVLNSYHAFK